jgi:DNA-binding response OmpR family regulator
MTDVSTHKPLASRSLALLLDDNLMSSSRVASSLSRLGYEVRTARHILTEQTPQLVVINLGSRGLDFAQLISNCRERFASARVIGFCGHREVEIRRAAKNAGIETILTNDQVLTEPEKWLPRA